MRARAKQQDWSKPFKLVHQKSQFQSLQTSEDTVVSITVKQPTAHSKQQIGTPQISTVKRITDIKPFAKIHPNYVRLASNLNLPRLNDYQLTEIDHVFIQTHRDKFKLNGKIVLTAQFLKLVIMALQIKQGKQLNLPRNKVALVLYLEKQFKELSKMTNYQNFTDTVYNYWRNRREQLKFPLYRPLWRASQQQYNTLLAFKFRQKEKRTLRRSSRTSQQDIIEQTTNQLGSALKISQRVQLRQIFKQKQVEVQLNLFHNQLRSIFPMPDFLAEISLESRAKDKERLKKCSGEVERIRREREVRNQEVKEPMPSIFDQKESVVNFLATVVTEAEICGIGYEKLFHYKSGTADMHTTPVFGATDLPPDALPPKISLIEQQQQQCINMSLRRAGDYILRHFQQDDDDSSSTGQRQIQNQNPIKRELVKSASVDELFDFKKKKISLYYFGDDDDGDYQNLRKNIATSFKKFQATKQMQ